MICDASVQGAVGMWRGGDLSLSNSLSKACGAGVPGANGL